MVCFFWSADICELRSLRWQGICQFWQDDGEWINGNDQAFTAATYSVALFAHWDLKCLIALRYHKNSFRLKKIISLWQMVTNLHRHKGDVTI